MNLQPTEVTVFSHKSIEYYTPPKYIESVKKVLGAIDLDPATDLYPQQWIKARFFYVEKDDGLTKPWFGRVFVNPPYSMRNGKSNQMLWSQKLYESWISGEVSEAILLVKAALGYNWFEFLFEHFPVCFTRERISFLTKEKEMPAAKQANAFFYFFRNYDFSSFREEFEQYGRVVYPE